MSSNNQSSRKDFPPFYNGPYGHSYFFNKNGVLSGVPTNNDGSPHWDCYDDEGIGLDVDEFAEPLTEEELKEVKDALAKGIVIK